MAFREKIVARDLFDGADGSEKQKRPLPEVGISGAGNSKGKTIE